jgi:hypothetical protein
MLLLVLVGALAHGQTAGLGVPFLGGAVLPALLDGQRRTAHEWSAAAHLAE